MKCQVCKQSLQFKKNLFQGKLYKCKYCFSEFVRNRGREVNYGQSFFLHYSDQVSKQIDAIKTENFKLMLLESYSSLAEKKILDIGCAQGYLLSAAKQLRASDLYGIDVSEWAISESKKKLLVENFS